MFLCPDILSPNEHTLNKYIIRCPQINVYKNHAPEEGVGRILISGFRIHVHVSLITYNLGFQGALHMLMNLIFVFCFLIFVSQPFSSNITNA